MSLRRRIALWLDPSLAPGALPVFRSRRFSAAEMADPTHGLMPGDMGEISETPRRETGEAAGPGVLSSLSVPARLRRFWRGYEDGPLGALAGALALFALALAALWLTEVWT